jgi:23S rRNA G2445 N2-methylase RlmL
MIHAATQNLKRLGFTTKQIVLSHSPISEYCPPSPPNLVITNPPYGIRLGTIISVLQYKIYLPHFFSFQSLCSCYRCD